jgi:hypothetical protein
VSNPARTEEDITTGLLALIAWAGNASAACRSLKAEGKMDLKPDTLTNWARGKHTERYNELREKYHEQIEAQIVHDLREISGQAIQVERLALEKAHAKLKRGGDDDPARTASHAARVAQSSVDKMLSLSGRPTSIREDRNATEIVRGLIAKGVLSMPKERPEELPVAPDAS